MVTLSSSRVRTIVCSFALLLPLLAHGDPGNYSTVSTLKEALTLAKKDGRLVFVELMAWNCPHCQAFERKVLASEEFQNYAAASLHLVIYDIKRQHKLTAEQRSEIAGLIKEHKLKATPAILLFSPDGRRLLPPSVGYKGTSPDKIVEHIQSVAANH